MRWGGKEVKTLYGAMCPRGRLLSAHRIVLSAQADNRGQLALSKPPRAPAAWIYTGASDLLGPRKSLAGAA